MIVKVFESPDMYRYEVLPEFARYIFDNHLEEFGRAQYQLAIQMDVPLLKHLTKYTEEELGVITKESLTELFEYLSNNMAREYVVISLQRWLDNDLKVIQSLDIMVEDITVLNYIRGHSFKQFIPLYTKELTLALKLSDEIEKFLMASSTSSMNTYIDMLKERLSKGEMQLLDAQSIANIGSFEWDLTNNLSESSPELKKILGGEGMDGLEEFLEQVHPEDVDKLLKSMTSAYETGTLDCEFRYNMGETEKTLWTRAQVDYDGSKTPLRMVGTVQDITQRKTVEETLLTKTIELERSNEDLQQFASVASHDLKEPLRKISMFADLILSGETNLSEASTRNMNRIVDASRRMGQLIEDILAYSSLNQQHQAQKVSLQKLFDEVLEVLEQSIKDKGAKITSDNLPHATVIPYQFRQLFQNLIANSLKFTKPDVQPAITVTHKFVAQEEVSDEKLRLSKRYLILEFKDNGIGFAPENAEKIFGLFSRLHKKTMYEGTGLGLAICRKVVEYHGGVIKATSQHGEGATFHMIIPQ